MALSGSEMGLRYHNRVAVVTGGTKGIGEAIVRLFVKNGANVIFCSKEENAEDLEKELLESGPGTGTYVSCDVTKEDEVRRLIDVTMKTHGRVDCLINNAGWQPIVYAAPYIVHGYNHTWELSGFDPGSPDPPEQRIDDTHAEEFLDLLKLNLIGYFLTAKYALPHLRKTQGNIINISSLVGIIGQKHAIPYVATKGAVTAMTKAMAVDESQYNVRVNSISPGNIWTPLWEELSSNSDNPEAMILGGKDAQLLGRMGTAEECAKAALYLAAEGTFCTGVDLLLTGGAELNYANKNQQETRSSIYH